LNACAEPLMLSLPVTTSSNASTKAPSARIGLAFRIGHMAAKQEGRPLAEDGSGRPFRVMIDVASGFRVDASLADFFICIGVNLN
jgi:hypothetical protein